MKRGRRVIIWFLMLLAIAFFALIILYAVLHGRYQKEYLAQIRMNIPEILQNDPYNDRNLVFIVIDGMRYDEVFGSEYKYIPHIWNDLRPQGTIFTNSWLDTVSLTSTVHSTWLAGCEQFVSNHGTVHPTFPTFSELFRDARKEWYKAEFDRMPEPAKFFPLAKETRAEIEKMLGEASAFPPEKTYCIAGKEHILDSIEKSSYPSFGDAYASIFYSIYDEEDGVLPDERIYQLYEARLSHDMPKIMFINLAETDEEGHTGDWDRYVDALRRADEIVWKMWQYAQSLPMYRDKTDFIILTDHGRHDDAHGGFTHHGDRCEGCMHIPMLFVGPDFKKGHVVDSYTNEYDIQPTIGAILGFKTPMAKGRILDEAFVDGFIPAEMLETERTAELQLKRGLYDRDTADDWFDVLSKDVASVELPELDELSVMAALLGYREIAAARDPGKRTIKRYNSGNAGFILPIALDYESLGGDNAEITIRAGVKDILSAIPSDISLKQLALYAPTLIRAGEILGEKEWVDAGAELLLDKIVELEGEEALRGTTDDYVSRFNYFDPEASMYKVNLTPREKALFLFAFGMSLEGTGEYFDEETEYLLNRHLRLQLAFAGPDCDEYCLYDGENAESYPPDVLATNFMYDAIIAAQPVWMKDEFDALGYGPSINQTSIHDFPPEHYFYLLNLGNAFLNSSTNYDKLRITVDWQQVLADYPDQADELILAQGFGTLAAARWGAITKEDYTFNLYPPEWFE